MGGCYSCHVAFEGKVYDLESECNHDNDNAFGHGGDGVFLRGSSKFISIYSKRGTKGVNQDAMTVWEDFTGKKDMIFCGVFDGHGPLGHKFSNHVRDNLPLKLSATSKQSQEEVCKLYDATTASTSYSGDFKGDDSQNLFFASWEWSFLKAFHEMDKDLAEKIDTDGFCGGTTAITIIKQGDHLMVGNLGDSRAILCTRENDNHLVPVQLSVDLNPDVPSEASRIYERGGRIFAAKGDPTINRIWRPNGESPGLAMSRAFGNFCLKDYGLISVPDISYRKLTNQDEFLVLATDGIWDVLTNEEVINIVTSAPKRSIAAKLLVQRATRAWKNKSIFNVDDCTAICLFLRD